MFIHQTSIQGFRNIKDINLELSPGVNVIWGENGQGKTNILEAIWLCTGCKSFRGAKEKEMLPLDEITDVTTGKAPVDGKKAIISLSMEDNQRKQLLEFRIERSQRRWGKEALKNGVKLPLASQLFGTLNCVLFTPDDLSLAKGSPECRRSFMDLSISQIRYGYSKALNRYNALLAQRNALLKSVGQGRGDLSQLELWDIQIVKTGSFITVYRYVYAKKLEGLAADLYESLSGGRERLTMEYRSQLHSQGALEAARLAKGNPDLLADDYALALKNSRSEDVRAGHTTVGCHRDDLLIFLDKKPVREFGSQGQQRSAALVLKLAQAQMLKDELGDHPVILLDDVLSELDPHRQSFVLSLTQGLQMIITCCDNKQFLPGTTAFHIQKGSLL